MNSEETPARDSGSINCSSAKYADGSPITHEWLESIFPDETMNGHCLLIPSDGHPVEVFLLEDLEEPGVYTASMMQSEPSDSIAITGRVFRTRGDVHLLLNALGHFV